MIESVQEFIKEGKLANGLVKVITFVCCQALGLKWPSKSIVLFKGVDAMFGPNPNDKEPMKGFPQVGFIKNFITQENIEVGEYSYYDDPEGPENFEKNVLYHFPFIGDKLSGF